MKPIIYIAGPYTADTLEQRNTNIARAEYAGRDIMAKGYAVIVPHKNTMNWEHDSRFTHSDFLDMDITILERCDAICVVGEYQHSKGTLQEISFAKENGLPIFFGVESVPNATDFQPDYNAQGAMLHFKQRRKGVAKYGAPLTKHTPINGFRYAAEESADQTGYLLQAADELDELRAKVAKYESGKV